MTILFRWAAWKPTRDLVFMLNYSVSSFRRVFGNRARYVVFTDEPAVVTELRLCDFEVVSVAGSDPRFLSPHATWRKWAPGPRAHPSLTEIYVDSDIFLLAPSPEIEDFCTGRNGKQFLASMESSREDWPYGNFARLLPSGFLPINAGLIGQFAGASLAPALEASYDWWVSCVSKEEIKYHDEQGAVAFAISPYIVAGQVELLDPSRYRIVSPRTDPPVETLDGLTMMHATYPEHPAFWRFLPQLSEITGLPPSM